MADEKVNVVLNVVAQVKDAIASISGMQEAFNKLHVPPSISTNLTRSMTAAKKEAEKYLDLINKPINGKTKMGAIDKQAEAMHSAITKMRQEFEKVPELKLDKMFNISNLPDLGKLEQQASKIKAEFAQAFKQGFSGDIGSNFSTGITSIIDKIKTDIKDLDASSEIKKTANELSTAFKALSQTQDLKSYDNFIDKFDRFQKSLITGGSQVQEALKPQIESIQKIIGEFQSQKLGQSGSSFNDYISKITGIDAEKARTVTQAIQELTNAAQGAAKTSAGMGIGLSNASSQLSEFGKVAQKTASQTEQFKSRLEWFFGAYNAINLFKRTIRSAFNTIKELDKAMTETAVVTDYTVSDMWKQLSKYTETASSLGATTKGAYETLTLYYQQGLNSTQAMQLGTETMKMARIAGIEYAEATDMMTAALRGFNMALNEDSAQRVNDVYSQLAAKTAASTEEIAVAMTKTASIANSANMDFETTAAFLTQIIETTREAPETAGTAMKTVIARFSEVKKLFSEGSLTGVDEEGEAIDINKIDTALKSVGMSLKKYILGQEGLDDVFLELASKWDTLDMATQRYIATQAAGSRQQSRFIAMMSNYSRTMELVDYAEQSAGAGQAQFEKTLDSMESKLNQLTNAWNDFTLGIANNDAVKTAVSMLTKLLEVINKLTSSFGSFGGIATKVGLGIGAFVGGNRLIQGISVRNSIKKDALGSGMSVGKYLAQPDKATEKSAWDNAFRNSFRNNYGVNSSLSEIDVSKFNDEIGKLEKEKAAALEEEVKVEQAISRKKQLESELTGKNNKKQRDLRNEIDKQEAIIKGASGHRASKEVEADLLAKQGERDRFVEEQEHLQKQQIRKNKAKQAAQAAGIALMLVGQGITAYQEDLKKSGNTNAQQQERLKAAADSASIMGTSLMVGSQFGPWGIAAGAAIGGVISAIKLYDAWTESAAEKTERLNKTVSESAQRITDLTNGYSQLKTSWQNYTEGQENLATLTRGTQEYNDAVLKQNQTVLELVEKNKSLVTTYDEDTGALTITKESYDELIDSQNKQIKTEQKMYNVHQMMALQNERAGIQQKKDTKLVTIDEAVAALQGTDTYKNYSYDDLVAALIGFYDAKLGGYNASNINKVYGTNLGGESSTKNADEYNRQLKENEIRFQGYAKNWAAQSLSETEKYSHSVVDIISDVASKEMSDTIDDFGETDAFKDFKAGELAREGNIENDIDLAKKYYAKQLGVDVSTIDFGEKVAGDIANEAVKMAYAQKDFSDIVKKYSKDYDELEAKQKTQISELDNLNIDKINELFTDIGDNKFLKAAQQRYAQERLNTYNQTNKILRQFTDLNQTVYESNLSNKQVGDLGTYGQMFGQVFGDRAGSVVVARMLESFKSEGGSDAFTDVLSNINFSSAISGISQLQAQVKLLPDDSEIKKELNNLTEYLQNLKGSGGFLNELFSSEDFQKVVDGFDKITDAGNQITADAIYDAADGCAILADYLDIASTSANTLAMILNDIALNGGKAKGFSDALIDALNVANEFNDHLDKSIQHVKNFQQVESDTQVGQFYGSRAKEIQTGFENGSWGDRQLIQSIGQFGSKASGKYANFMKSFGSGMITRDQLLTQFNKQLGRYNDVFKQVAETGNLGAVWSNLSLFSDIYDKGRNKKGELQGAEADAYKAFTDLVTIKNGQVNLSKEGRDATFDEITAAIKGMFPDDPQFAEDLITDLVVNSPDMYTKLQTKQAEEGSKTLMENELTTTGDITQFLRMFGSYLSDQQKKDLETRKESAIALDNGWATGKEAAKNIQTLNAALEKSTAYGGKGPEGTGNIKKYLESQEGVFKDVEGNGRRKETINETKEIADTTTKTAHSLNVSRDVINDSWSGITIDIEKATQALMKFGATEEEAKSMVQEYADENDKAFSETIQKYNADSKSFEPIEIISDPGETIDEFSARVEQMRTQFANEDLASAISESMGLKLQELFGEGIDLKLNADTTGIDTTLSTYNEKTINIYLNGIKTGDWDIPTVKKRHGQPGARRNAIPGFAEGKQGSRHNYEGIALVGEEGPELVSGDDGMRVVGQNGEELTYVHKEDAIYTNQDTRKLLGGTKSHIPGFAEGNSSLDDLIKVLNRLCEELMNMKIRIEYPDQSTEETKESSSQNEQQGTGNTQELKSLYGINNKHDKEALTKYFNGEQLNSTEQGRVSQYDTKYGPSELAMAGQITNFLSETFGLSYQKASEKAAEMYANRQERDKGKEPPKTPETPKSSQRNEHDELREEQKLRRQLNKTDKSTDIQVDDANISVKNANDNASDGDNNKTDTPSEIGSVDLGEGIPQALADETIPVKVEGDFSSLEDLPEISVPASIKADTAPVTSALSSAVSAVQGADGTTAEFHFKGVREGFWPVSRGSGVGAAFGSALASGTYQSVGGNTLVGELGQEMVVDPHNGSWYTVGDTGAEFASLPKDAIVFNHKQTEGLLKYGRINNRGQARAFGNAMLTGYAGGTKTRASHNRSGRGGGGSSKDNEWKNPYDRFYNLIEDIDRELKRQTGIQKKIDKASRDNSLAKNFKEYTTTHKEELKLMQDMTDSYRESMALNKELLEGKEWELQNFMDEHSDMLKYGWYDFDKDEVQMNWDLINSVKDNDTGKKIEEYISGLEKLNDKFWDAAESYDDAAENIRKQVDEARELIQEQREGYLDLEERVIDALIDARQKEIDKLSEISDTLDRDNSDILDSVRDMVDEQRRLRDLQEQQDDLEKKQRRLSLLRRDSSGANALEIMQLEEELKNDTRNLTDTLVDEGLDKLEKANEEAQKQRERQIELLSNLLEIDKENGAFNVQAQQLIAGALNNDEEQTLNVFSDMVALLQEAEGWVSKSIFAQQEWIKELKSATFVANQGLEYFLNTQLEDTIISAMEKETARGVGTTVTDLSGNTRTLVNKYSQEDIAAQGEKVKKAYDNAAEARRALQEFEDIDYKDWLTQNGYKNNSTGKAAYQKEYNRLRTAVEEADIEKLNQDRIASAMAKNVLGYVDENGNFVEYVDTSEIDTENHKSQYYYDGKYYDTMTDAQMAKNQALQKSQADLKDIQKKFNTLEKEYQKALTAMNNAKADYLIAASTSGEDSKAAKSASDTYTKKKKAYDEAYNKYQAQKSLLNSQNEVIEELQYLQIYGPFKQGGLANFTGLAKLDGTPSRPEAILDAKDTKNFIQLKNVLRDLELNGLQGGNTYYEVHIDVDKLESDYDVDKVANRVKELIVSSAQYRNNNTINHLR